MLEGVSVLVPYRPDDGYRDQAWQHVVRPAWEALGVELIVKNPGPGMSPAEFNHPKAINAAARNATREVLIVADADTYWGPEDLPSRLVASLESGAQWAMPRRYAQLTVTQSRSIVRGGRAQPLDRLHTGAGWVGDSVSWAGLVCVRADDFWRVGGYDERWEFWGADDMAFGLAMDTLVGPHERVEGTCLHLWHPTPLEHNYGHKRHRFQHNLGELYKRAAGDPVAMRQVRFGGEA